MKRRTKIIIAAGAVLALLAGAYSIFASFNGSYIVRTITTMKVKEYVKENFPDEALEVDYSIYDFKCMGYFCNVHSNESEDTHFIVWNTDNGLTDDYEFSVLGHQNTLARLCKSQIEYADQLMEDIYPYRTSLVLCDSYDVTDQDLEKLTLDMPYDPMNYPLDSTLTVWVETQNDTPGWEELEERFVELDSLVHDKLPSVKYYSISLQDHYVEENGEYVPVDYNSEVLAFDVPRDVVRSDTLKDYLAEVKTEQEAEREAIEKGESDGK